MAISADPQTDICQKVTGIVAKVVLERLDGMTLQSRELPCAMAAATMRAADLTVD
jgi:hypothetical protein